MGDSAIRAVISDFGGVLTTPLMHSFAAFQDETGIPPEALGTAMQRIAEADGEHPLYELERGRISEDSPPRRARHRGLRMALLTNNVREWELLTSEEREELGRLRSDNRELRRANEILKAASVFFAKQLDPPRPK